MELKDFIVHKLNKLERGQAMIYQLLTRNGAVPKKELEVMGDLLSEEVEEPKPRRPLRETANQVPSNQGDQPAFARFIPTEGA